MAGDVKYVKDFDREVEEKMEGFRDKLREFCEKSSVFALGRIHSGSRIQRILWTIMTVFMTVMFCVQVKDIFITYLSYPSDNVRTTGLSAKLDFPAITVCNLSPARLSIVREWGWDSSLQIDSMPNETDALYEMWSSQSSGVGKDNYPSVNNYNKWDMLEETNDTNLSKDQVTYYETMDTCYFVQRTFKKMVAELPIEKKTIVGHQINDFIVSCKWLGRNCSPKNFTSYFDASYTVCHTFNSGRMTTEETVPETLTVSGSGPMNALEIEFYIEQDEYINTLAPQAGVRIQIHDPRQMPIPAFEGFSISPGYATSVGIKRTDYTNLPPPYGDCQDIPANSTLYNQFGADYSVLACIHTCIQTFINIICNCTVPDFPTNTSYAELHICEVVGETKETKGIDADCVNSQFQRAHNGVCACPRACSDTDYTMLISTSQFPSMAYWNAFEKRLNQTSAKTVKNVNIPINIVKLEVYYQDMESTTSVYSASYRVDKLLGDLGGLLGLWLGFSFITIAELGEFIVDIVHVVGKKYIKKKARKWPSLAHIRSLHRKLPTISSQTQVKPFEEKTICTDKV